MLNPDNFAIADAIVEKAYLHICDTLFSNSRRLRRALAVLIQSNLNERGPLSEGVFLHEAFPRATEASSARVGASTLRQELDYYYKNQGAKDAIKFEIPQTEGHGYSVIIHRETQTPSTPNVNEKNRALLSYLARVIEECSRTPSYFPDRLNGGLAHMHQQVEVITERELFDRFRAEERERLRAAGQFDYAPHHARALKEAAVEEERRFNKPRPATLNWRDTRNPAISRFQRTVVLGDPGFGKSWLLKHEASLVARMAQEATTRGVEIANNEIPVFVRLADVCRRLIGSPITVATAITATFEANDRYSPDDVAIVRSALRDNRALVLLDAWDEVNAGQAAANVDSRNTVHKRLATFCDSYEGRIVATSRSTRYIPGLLGERSTEVELLAFDPNAIAAFIVDWFKNGDPMLGRHLQQKIDLPTPLRELARIPLLLSLICSTFEKDLSLPQTRGELYERVLKKLLFEWPNADQKEFRMYAEEFHRDQKTLGQLALKLQLENQFDGQFLDHAWKTERSTDADVDRLRNRFDEAGIFVRVDDGARMFLHRSFQEYLTAYALSQSESVIAEINKLSLRPEWHEVIVLLGVHTSPAPIVKMLRDEHASCVTNALHPRLALAGRLLAESPSRYFKPTADLRREVYKDLWKFWKSVNNQRAVYQHIRHSLIGLLTVDPMLVLDDIRAARQLHAAIPAIIDFCIHKLDDSDPTIRYVAVRTIEEMGLSAGQNAIRALIGKMTVDSDPHIRTTAAHALGSLGADELTTAALVQRIIEPDLNDNVRAAAAEALGLLGPCVDDLAIATLTRMISEPDHSVKVCLAAAKALDRLGTRAGRDASNALEQIVANANSPAGVRRAAAEALGTMGIQLGATSVTTLLDTFAICGPDDALRLSIIKALEQIAPPVNDDVVSLLVRTVIARDSDFFLRTACAKALGVMGPAIGPPALRALGDAITNPNTPVKVFCPVVGAVGLIGPEIGQEVIMALVSAMTQPNRQGVGRWDASQALTAMGTRAGERAINALLNTLTEPHLGHEVARLTASALEAMVPALDERAIGGLVDALIEPKSDPVVRFQIARVLGKVGRAKGQFAIDTLAEVITDPRSVLHVRICAVGVVGNMGPPAGIREVRALIEVLTNAKFPVDLRISAAQALGQFGPTGGDKAAVALYHSMAESPIRLTAIEALGKIGPGGELAIPILAQTFADVDYPANVRIAAVTALGAIMQEVVNENAIRIIIDSVIEQDRSYAVQRASIVALIQIGFTAGDLAIEAILKAMSQAPNWMSDICWRGLEQLTSAGLPRRPGPSGHRGFSGTM